MMHQGGLSSVSGLSYADLADLDRTAKILAAQELCWVPPDERVPPKDPVKAKLPRRQIYHALSRGLFSNELVRRVDGRSMGRFIAEEITIPLGIEFYVGLPESLEDRVCPLIEIGPLNILGVYLAHTGCKCLRPFVNPSNHLDPDEKATFEHAIKSMNKRPKTGVVPNHGEIVGGTFGTLNMIPLSKHANSRTYHSVEVPSAGGVTNARGSAKLAALLANKGELDGIRLLSVKTFEKAMEQQSQPVWDELLNRDSQMCTAGWGRGTCGLQGGWGQAIHTTNEYFQSFPEYDKDTAGWGGAGGSACLFFPENQLAMGYVMNSMSMLLISDRSMRIRNALLTCLRDIDKN